jgi:hypothetical protein
MPTTLDARTKKWPAKGRAEAGRICNSAVQCIAVEGATAQSIFSSSMTQVLWPMTPESARCLPSSIDPGERSAAKAPVLDRTVVISKILINLAARILFMVRFSVEWFVLEKLYRSTGSWRGEILRPIRVTYSHAKPGGPARG